MTRIIHDLRILVGSDTEELLEFDHNLEEDVVDIRLGGYKIGSCDWSGNLMIVVQDMIDNALKLGGDLAE